MDTSFQLFEEEVMRMLLAGKDEVLQVLRNQHRESTVLKREFTGVGFYTTFHVSGDSNIIEGKRSFRISDVIAEMDGHSHGIGLLLFVSDGKLNFLEGYTYGDESWPESVGGYQVRYMSGLKRDLVSEKVKWG